MEVLLANRNKAKIWLLVRRRMDLTVVIAYPAFAEADLSEYSERERNFSWL